jgi:hypothetical protein
MLLLLALLRRLRIQSDGFQSTYLNALPHQSRDHKGGYRRLHRP